jgi:hypothetical protein
MYCSIKRIVSNSVISRYSILLSLVPKHLTVTSSQKDTGLTERARLKFRVEAFNLFNHPNFDAPNRIAFTPNFGRIFSADAPRQLQFGLKIEF